MSKILICSFVHFPTRCTAHPNITNMCAKRLSNRYTTDYSHDFIHMATLLFLHVTASTTFSDIEHHKLFHHQDSHFVSHKPINTSFCNLSRLIQPSIYVMMFRFCCISNSNPSNVSLLFPLSSSETSVPCMMAMSRWSTNVTTKKWQSIFFIECHYTLLYSLQYAFRVTACVGEIYVLVCPRVWFLPLIYRMMQTWWMGWPSYFTSSSW